MRRKTRNARKLGTIRRLTEKAVFLRLSGRIAEASRIESGVDSHVRQAERMGLDTISAEERAHNRAFKRYRNL